MSTHRLTKPLSIDHALRDLSPLTKNLLRFGAILIGVCLLTLAAKTKVQIWAIPITMQTLAICFIGAAFGAKLGFATVMAYLAAGLYGLPVFTNTPPSIAGPAYFLGPTGGYLLMFPLAAALTGWFSERGYAKKPFHLFGVMTAAHLLILAGGFLWLALFAAMASGAQGIGFEASWLHGVQPFLLTGALKAALGAALVPALFALFDRRA